MFSLTIFWCLTLGMPTITLALFLSVRSISSHHLWLTTTILWAAILLYDYCLKFVAEVERCWVGKLNWVAGFFYLNRYLTLFGHVPIMMEYFWSTPNPNKVEVSILHQEEKLRGNAVERH